jgi:hypothetical protein
MRNVWLGLWNDDLGASLLTGELLFIFAILVLGTITGLVAVRQAVNSELTESANTILSLNQSYSFSGQGNCEAGTAGSATGDFDWRVPPKNETAGSGVRPVWVVGDPDKRTADDSVARTRPRAADRPTPSRGLAGPADEKPNGANPVAAVPYHFAGSDPTPDTPSCKGERQSLQLDPLTDRLLSRRHQYGDLEQIKTWWDGLPAEKQRQINASLKKLQPEDPKDVEKRVRAIEEQYWRVLSDAGVGLLRLDRTREQLRLGGGGRERAIEDLSKALKIDKAIFEGMTLKQLALAREFLNPAYTPEFKRTRVFDTKDLAAQRAEVLRQVFELPWVYKFLAAIPELELSDIERLINETQPKTNRGARDGPVAATPGSPPSGQLPGPGRGPGTGAGAGDGSGRGAARDDNRGPRLRITLTEGLEDPFSNIRSAQELAGPELAALTRHKFFQHLARWAANPEVREDLRARAFWLLLNELASGKWARGKGGPLELGITLDTTKLNSLLRKLRIDAATARDLEPFLAGLLGGGISLTESELTILDYFVLDLAEFLVTAGHDARNHLTPFGDPRKPLANPLNQILTEEIVFVRMTGGEQKDEIVGVSPEHAKILLECGQAEQVKDPGTGKLLSAKQVAAQLAAKQIRDIPKRYYEGIRHGDQDKAMRAALDAYCLITAVRSMPGLASGVTRTVIIVARELPQVLAQVGKRFVIVARAGKYFLEEVVRGLPRAAGGLGGNPRVLFSDPFGIGVTTRVLGEVPEWLARAIRKARAEGTGALPAEVKKQLATELGATEQQIRGIEGKTTSGEIVVDQAQQLVGLTREESGLIKLAEEAEGKLGTFPKRKTAAAEPDGTRTLSGWSKKEGFVQATEKVMDAAEDIGHELKKHNFDQGELGRYFSSHAEKQLAVLADCEAIAVSRPMCKDCQTFFQKFAVYKQRTLVVADPKAFRVFRPTPPPNGSVLVILR